jgi:hypothetical protein
MLSFQILLSDKKLAYVSPATHCEDSESEEDFDVNYIIAYKAFH